ncbi:DUF2388 domain-containing protein [Pseudomonas sp. CAN2814]|uniref:DUF2388 domain-containing protein n=1 Tax=Pseudomonas sp. CAN1 TaxID=3046726 RepID=UPI002649A88E|nr:DUF2388 domain-containing protein [Pseudomonas sp. CAN1]MDN6860965.1 DUF2388 domain-containing protein [Pseudomonas sp. CAN1]
MLRRGAFAVALLASASQAGAMDGKGNSSDHFTIATSLGTAAVSESSSQAPRAYQLAHDDALAYVASAGRIHGAQLEQALRVYRQEHPRSTSSDWQLAQAFASR